MAIEALNSAISYQAQTTKQAKPVQKTVVEDTEVTTTQGKAVSGDIAAGTKVGEAEKQDSQSGQNGSQNQQPSNEQLKKAVEQLNKSMPHSEAIFGFHEETNRVMIKIVDKDTKEVIKELPPEKTLDMIAKVWELAGMFLDERG